MGHSWLLKGMSRNQTRRKKPKGHQEKPFCFLPSLAGWDGRPSPCPGASPAALGPAQLPGRCRQEGKQPSLRFWVMSGGITHAHTNRSCFPVAASQHPAELPLPPAPLPTLPPRRDHGCSRPSHRLLLMTHPSCSALIRLLSN